MTRRWRFSTRMGGEIPEEVAASYRAQSVRSLVEMYEQWTRPPQSVHGTRRPWVIQVSRANPFVRWRAIAYRSY